METGGPVDWFGFFRAERKCVTRRRGGAERKMEYGSLCSLILLSVLSCSIRMSFDLAGGFEVGGTVLGREGAKIEEEVFDGCAGSTWLSRSIYVSFLGLFSW